MIPIENQFKVIGLHFPIFIATFKIYYFKTFFCASISTCITTFQVLSSLV